MVSGVSQRQRGAGLVRMSVTKRKTEKAKTSSQLLIRSWFHTPLWSASQDESLEVSVTQPAPAYLSVSVHFSSSSRAILSILCFSSSLVVMSLASWWRCWVSSSPCESDAQHRRISEPTLPDCCRSAVRLHPKPSVSLGIPEKIFWNSLQLE